MLEVKALSKSYRGLPAIDNVSFAVRAGEIVGYVGPNGSGKSTTVKIITGLLEPTDGQVLFEGQSIRDNLQAYRAAFGYVPEEAHVYTHLSGLEYLQLVGRLRNMPEALIDLKANRLLTLLGLESWRHSPISLYSKGMKQRVLISAALLHDPRLLIFDEPLSGLDVVSARLFKDLLAALAAQGKAILYISHVLEVVELVCDRVIVIAKGKILADAPPCRAQDLPANSPISRASSPSSSSSRTPRVSPANSSTSWRWPMPEQAATSSAQTPAVLSLSVQAETRHPRPRADLVRGPRPSSSSPASFTTNSSPPTTETKRVMIVSYAVALPGLLVALFLLSRLSRLPAQPIHRTFWAQACDHYFYVMYSLHRHGSRNRL